jgi:hypothetical protein
VKTSARPDATCTEDPRVLAVAVPLGCPILGARREWDDAVRCSRVTVKCTQSGRAYLAHLHKRLPLHGLSKELRCSGRRGRRFKSCHPDAVVQGRGWPDPEPTWLPEWLPGIFYEFELAS